MTTEAIRRAKLQLNCHHQQTNSQLFTGQLPFLLSHLIASLAVISLECSDIVRWAMERYPIPCCSPAILRGSSLEIQISTGSYSTCVLQQWSSASNNGKLVSVTVVPWGSMFSSVMCLLLFSFYIVKFLLSLLQYLKMKVLTVVNVSLIVVAVHCSSAHQLVFDSVWHGRTSTLPCRVPGIKVFNSRAHTRNNKKPVVDVAAIVRFTSYVF